MADPHVTAGRLYGFVDTAYFRGRDPGALAAQLVAGGVDLLQVRAKDLARPQRIELALAVVAAARKRHIPVIVNDDLDAAFEAGADGVHLGQEDWAAIPAADRTTRLANMRIVGLSTHSLEQAMAAERHGVDYIGVGPIFSTGTKPGVKPVGVELIRRVAAWVHIPFFAIGGINLGNLDQVLQAGATRVAIVSAILAAPDATQAATEFRRRLRQT